ncbi:MAG TPA: hypothetical protein VJT50_14110 [Pyrinomonadaceae bacterium]|nr:hypothetical protein [Pyrinomonadaceae bacterium]
MLSAVNGANESDELLPAFRKLAKTLFFGVRDRLLLLSADPLCGALTNDRDEVADDEKSGNAISAIAITAIARLMDQKDRLAGVEVE